jgi:hypothetical protein
LGSVTASRSSTSVGLVELSAAISSLSSMESDPLNSRIPLPDRLAERGQALGSEDDPDDHQDDGDL